MIDKLLRFGHINCRCIAPDASATRIIYILFPLQGTDRELAELATESGAAMVSVTGMDWDNDLTPWVAPGAPAGEPPFQGLAPAFLKLINDRVVPGAEHALGVTPYRRQLVGVSLSGLFALWQWMQSPLFDDIACLSGSFWYQGFVEWLSSITIPQRSGLAWFCLGDMEAHTKVKAFQSVATDTREVLAILRAAGIHAEFRSVPGTHYQHLEPRLHLALRALASATR
ncbi:MAG: alpha/beta hydrolase-fold protein [Candidatus Amulumruptor caecigallinarius]|nr:alpha/beta hydrolase-fold protein [Candidatus Amulumruptor caecigallinarius]MCM1397497.1 alpha/beta hydrolase-fold protein [Candidatus Amulumruptor caecigallinarius]MCM1454399.1 alpha/beta hydrolase-fold protein [bacterium]